MWYKLVIYCSARKYLEEIANPRAGRHLYVRIHGDKFSRTSSRNQSKVTKGTGHKGTGYKGTGHKGTGHYEYEPAKTDLQRLQLSEWSETGIK